MDICVMLQQLADQFTATWAAILKLLMPVLVLFGLSGCVDPNASPEMQEAQLSQSLQIVEKVADLADRQGFAWSADLSMNGSPSVGEKLEFFLDTGIRIDINMHGNASAGRMPDPTVTGSDG